MDKIVKKFKEWIGLKEKIDSYKKIYPQFREGEVWWVSVGENIGVEISGKSADFSRPVLIYRKLSNEGFLGIPMSTKIKEGTWYSIIDFGNKKINIILSQVRVFSSKRMHTKMGELSKHDREKVSLDFFNLYFLNNKKFPPPLLEAGSWVNPKYVNSIANHNKSVKLLVPFYSQFNKVTLDGWQDRACAPTCLKMVLQYLSDGDFKFSIDDLILEGTTIVGGYIEGIGWAHAGLIRIAHNHGFLAYDEEFRSIKINIRKKSFEKSDFEEELVTKGIKKIKKTLENGVPVIISCSASFTDKHRPHQVVLVGYDEAGFYYHEPEARDDSGANRFVDLETFRKHWRKFAIFLNK